MIINYLIVSSSCDGDEDRGKKVEVIIKKLNDESNEIHIKICIQEREKGMH